MNPTLATLLTISLPTLSVLVGILLNKNDINNLRGDMRSLETGLRGEMAALRGEVVSLRASFHSDVVMLLDRDSRLEQRVSRLERIS